MIEIIEVLFSMGSNAVRVGATSKQGILRYFSSLSAAWLGK
jgi:hypothetical protein